jgi:hypothetical protein
MTDLDEHEKRQREANERAEKIRGGLQQTGVLFAKAVTEQDWRTLHYESIGDWAVSEFGHDRFSVDRRKEVVDLLTKAGLTTRAIAAATGANQSTIVRDQAAGDANASQGYDAFGEEQGTEPLDMGSGPGEPERQTLADLLPLPPATPPSSPRQDAAKAREATRRAEVARLEHEARATPQPNIPEAAHEHVFDRCTCGAVRPPVPTSSSAPGRGTPVSKEQREFIVSRFTGFGGDLTEREIGRQLGWLTTGHSSSAVKAVLDAERGRRA